MIHRDELFRSKSENLTFDDVSLVEGRSKVDSRSEVDIKIEFRKGNSIALPVMTASMDTITSKEMAEVVLNEGGGIVHHRYAPIEDRVEALRHGEYERDHYKGLNGVAVGYGDTYYDVEALIEAGAELVSLDLAHAWHNETAKWIEERADLFENTLLVVGSFSHPDGIQWLYDEELKRQGRQVVDIVRVSQGGGSACTTRQKAGVGKATLQAVIDYNLQSDLPYEVMADGGIKYPGDIAKSIGAGACAGMIGGMLAGTDECPGKVMNIDGEMYKEYRGMASRSAKKDDDEVDTNYIEGIATKVPVKGPAKKVLRGIRDGLKSSISTCGFRDIESFREGAEFIRLSHSSQIESTPHKLRSSS